MNDDMRFLETYSTKAQRLTATLEQISVWAQQLDECLQTNDRSILRIVADMRQWTEDNQ